MAETPETNKPDFRNGFPIRDLRDGSMIWATHAAVNRRVEVIRDRGRAVRFVP
jgi:hypothetical protein